MPIMALIPLIQALPKVIAMAPEFENLFNEFVRNYNSTEQEQLKSAYQAARERSDSAQADFVQASRGD